jgi:hypothetical protein
LNLGRERILENQAAKYEDKLGRLVEALEKGPGDCEGVQARLLRLLDPLPFDAEIMQHVLRFTGRQWVFDRVDAWLTDSNSPRLFWITGKPGVGKTAVAAWLCHKRPDVVAFHLCRHGHVQKADPRRCVLSLAYQLTSQLPDYQDRLNALNLEAIIAESNARTLFDRLIVQPLSCGFPRPNRTMIVVIDALDEATQLGRNELASFLATDFRQAPDWLRLLITSRPDPEVEHPLQALAPYVLDTSAPQNEEDLRTFMRREFVEFSASDRVPDASVEVILTKSEGVFLYVEWVREELAKGRLKLDRPDQFPQGLGGVYVEFFARQFSDIPLYKREVRPALEAICTARESMKVDDLASMLGWGNYEREETLGSFGSLFPVFEDRIQPFHQSVKDWLMDKTKAGPYFVSEQGGHRRLADFCWSQYESGVATMSEFSLRYALFHLRQVQDAAKADEIDGNQDFRQRRFQLGLRKIFISYAPRDAQDFTRRLQSDLVAHGHEVWQWENTMMRADEPFEKQLEREIASADILISILTPHAVKGDSVTTSEIAYAVVRGLRVIPIMLQDCDLPIYIFHLQYLDIRDSLQSPERYQQEFHKLLEILGGAWVDPPHRPGAVRV